MNHYKLKQGDEVFIFWDGKCKTVKVNGFYCYGMETSIGIIPFFARSFYSAGYHGNVLYITVSKKWHYHISKVLEDFRYLWHKFLYFIERKKND